MESILNKIRGYEATGYDEGVVGGIGFKILKSEEGVGVRILDAGGLSADGGLLFEEDHFGEGREGEGEEEEKKGEEVVNTEVAEKEEVEDGCCCDDEGYEEDDTNNKIDSGDEDEEGERLYIISIDGAPYYYLSDLDAAKDRMIDLGKEFIRNLDARYGCGHKMLCDFRLKKLEVIAPYSILGLFYYNRKMYDLTIDYVKKLD